MRHREGAPAMRVSARGRRVGLELLATATLLLVAGRSGFAKDCGGPTPCSCGDRVVASSTLDTDLNGCDVSGLTVVAGVLDCAGRQISGPGDRTDTVGIEIAGVAGAGATGAVVQNCRVRNFGRGIEIRGGSGNVLRANTLFDNEAGIWLAAGAAANTIEQNYVHDNRDEGIHLGSDAMHNTVTDNAFVNNRSENVYLLGAHHNVIRGNTLDGAKAAAIFVKNAASNTFEDNEILDRNVVLRGDADGNVFVENQLENGSFVIQAYEESDGTWRYPNGNTISGGLIRKASTCFELVGAYDTVATDVVVSSCEPKQEKPAGGLVPYGNQIAVVREDLGDPSSGQRRTGSLSFAPVEALPDRFRLDVRNVPLPLLVDPTTVDFGCSLTDGLGNTVLSVALPAGALEPRGDGGRFIDTTGAAGVSRLDVNQTSAGVWQVRMSGRTQLGALRLPTLRLDCHLGESSFVYRDLWSGQSRRFRLRVQP